MVFDFSHNTTKDSKCLAIIQGSFKLSTAYTVKPVACENGKTCYQKVSKRRMPVCPKNSEYT